LHVPHCYVAVNCDKEPHTHTHTHTPRHTHERKHKHIHLWASLSLSFEAHLVPLKYREQIIITTDTLWHYSTGSRSSLLQIHNGITVQGADHHYYTYTMALGSR